MSHRFFVEALIEGNEAQLQGSEAHHVLKVMRGRVGDQLVLFDGSGDEFAARIARVDRTNVFCEVLQRRQVDRELPCHLTLGVALPKGDRQRWLVEKAVELGVSRLIPLETERSVAQPGEKALERLCRTVVEASKQCGRNRLMEVSAVQTLSEFAGADWGSCLKVLAEPGGEAMPATFPDSVAACIGPEGGLTAEESALARECQWRPVSLGGRILRIETAALAVAAAVSLGCLKPES